jgi:serine/threonine protein kinase/formylglycine-generating enzyme required for sulfatase activity
MRQGATGTESEWQPPKLFDGYRVLWTHRTGARGLICVGQDVVVERPVVIRFIPVPPGDLLGRDHFFSEARAAARLQHPNIATVHRIGEVDGWPFIVSEYVRGTVLQALPRPISTREALHIGLGIARGLAAAHRQGVLHRDLRPSSVMRSSEGEIKLLDLGLGDLIGVTAVPPEPPASPSASTPEILPPGADDQDTEPGDMRAPELPPDKSKDKSKDKAQDKTREKEPEPATVHPEVADPAYRAPEVLRGEPATARSDVYAFGVLMFELCTGVLPSDSPDKRASHRGTMDPRLYNLLERCLQPDPEARFASGEELRDALEQLSPGTGALVLPEGNPYRGLLPFEAEHRALFFGRRSEIGTLIERLRTEPCILIAAESGVGKSSLCRAGILPLIGEGALGDGRTWQHVTMVPGRNPLRALAAALAPALGRLEEALTAELRQSPGSLLRTLNAAGSSAGVLLFVDQLEELSTLAAPDEAQIVGEALGALLTRTQAARLLVTARSDYLGRIAMLPGIGDVVSRSLYILRPLGPDKIREVVVGPAHAKGVAFESPALVNELVETTARTDGGLPLLQFALAELWEAREGNRITAAALRAIGGVSGALARHADLVLSSLPPAQRTSARRILMSLVTLEGTRARRTEEELLGADPPARPALEALVRGRLLVAGDTAEGAAYEVAHEALIRGWGTLRRWLEEYAESRAVRQRLEQAAAEWRRIARAPEGLWGQRQLQDLELLEPGEIGPREAEFVQASRRRARRRQVQRNAILASLPLLAAAIYGVAEYAAQRSLARKVTAHLEQGRSELATAELRSREVDELRRRAFAAFDAQKIEAGEELWQKAQTAAGEVDRLFSRASQTFEAALTADNSSTASRELLADVLYKRALCAERDRRHAHAQDLTERLALYDTGGARQQLLNQPGEVTVLTDPPGALLTLARYQSDAQRKLKLVDSRELGAAPLPPQRLPPGSYLLTLSAPGRVEVRYPFLVSRGQPLRLEVPLPRVDQVPPGFVFVPAGKFLFGSATEEAMRKSFLSTVPLHEVSTGPYLIARHETTYGEWLDFLRAQPPAERTRLATKVAKGALVGGVELNELAGGAWQLTLQPVGERLVARSDEPIVYPGRKQRARQSWLRFPVGGVSLDDAERYARWLDATDRVPGARLCTEWEWERAARGADDREWPHGDQLDPEDANFDLTYGRDNGAMGPDEVGSFPASASPFGLLDMAGNAAEWTIGRLRPDESVVRSASYFFAAVNQRATNRNVVDRSLRDPGVTLRLCASFPPRPSPAPAAPAAAAPVPPAPAPAPSGSAPTPSGSAPPP